MTAAQFEEIVGKIERPDDEGIMHWAPKDEQAFEKLMDTLAVIGRAQPIHKQIIASGLKAMGRKVAVIGESISDLDAFKVADVSFAMGGGASICRNHASMVLLEDNFASCVRALWRGRNIYSNIKRFLQFQITVNFAILICLLIGIIYMVESPFNAVMLIWINLIMDTMAALALATAAPLPRDIQEPAVTDDVQILSPVLWRQIYGITIWNIIVMCVMIFFSGTIFGYTETSQKVTMIFNTFIFLQFFNQINCRVVGPKDFNVFTSFFNNWIFLVVLASIFAIQWFSVASANTPLAWLFGTTQIPQKDFWTSVIWGSTTLVVSFILKCTPQAWIEKMPIKIDENSALGENSKLVRLYEGKKSEEARPVAAAVNDDDF